ncbi:hypothetical protein NDU88_006622 [Pleurodeles waltl]|uniref:Uncharacterized protein n=1 Tax=Pleurodeles waltl TaxID=8319 RepID=A0AAV7SQ50_PLEWA|nr:hypothetical protein NDU88_006622 [Pleurodeles waltl]
MTNLADCEERRAAHVATTLCTGGAQEEEERGAGMRQEEESNNCRQRIQHCPRPTTRPPRADSMNSMEDEDGEEVFLISFTNDLKRHRRPQPTCTIDVESCMVKPLKTPGSL